MLRNLVPMFSIIVSVTLLAACDTGTTAPATSTSPAPTATMSGMNMGDMETPAGTVTITSDVQFIEMMVPHHQLAVDMSKLAQEKATRPELKGLVADIIMTQQDEVNRMNLWLVELSGKVATPGVSGMPGMDMGAMPGMDVDLEKLAASPNFDRDFLVAMIPHHQSAIEMSRAALPNLKHEPLRALAQDIITTQQIEIDRMNGWLKEWK